MFIGGGLALFAWRAPLLKHGGLFAPISREGALVLNNLFLTTACATVFVGTLYPLALEAFTGEKISVGAPFFNTTFGPLFAALLLAVPFGPLLAWKRGDLGAVAQRLSGAFLVALIGLAATWVVEAKPLIGSIGVGLALFVIIGAVTEIVERIRIVAGTALDGSASRRGPAPVRLGYRFRPYGPWCYVARDRRRNAVEHGTGPSMKQGDKVAIRNYELTFDHTVSRSGPNFSELAVVFPCVAMATSWASWSRRSAHSRARHRDDRGGAKARGFSHSIFRLATSPPMARGHPPLLQALVCLIWLGAVVMCPSAGSLAVGPAAARRGAHAGARTARSWCRPITPMRWSKTMRCSLEWCDYAPPPAVAVPPDEILRTRPWRRAHARYRASCVAWYVRTSRSTIPRPRLPAICVSAAGAADRRRFRSPGARFSGGALWGVRAAGSRASNGRPRHYGSRRPLPWLRVPSRWFWR